MKTIVDLNDDALMQILLNGLETFIVRHDHVRRSGIEMYGHLIGKYSQSEKRRRIKVTHFNCDTSATMSPGMVLPKADSDSLKKDLIEGFGFHYLGRLHSHPYHNQHWSNAAAVRRHGAEFSEPDRKAGLETLSERYQSFGNRWHLEMVATFYHMKNAVAVPEYDDYMPEFSIGNIRCFLRADIYEILDDGMIGFSPALIQSSFIERGRERKIDIGRVRVKSGRKYTLHRLRKGVVL